MKIEKMKEMKIELASQFARLGIPLIPVHPNSKKPAIDDWPNQGVTDKSIIQSWFDADPECNYGLVTGHGFVVLDIDVKNGKNGFEGLASITKGEIPSTLTVKTPSSGYHYYFAVDEQLKGKRPATGVDFQAYGQFVLGPGSVIDGMGYEIVIDKAIEPIPEWLLSAVNKETKVVSTKKKSSTRFHWDTLLDKAEAESIKQHLGKIDPGLPYNDWLITLYSIYNVWGSHDDVIQLTESWSAQSDNFNRDEFLKKVASFDPHHEKKSGLPRLRQLAQKYPKTAPILPYSDEAHGLDKQVFDELVALLAKRENTLSEGHRDALHQVCQALVHGVFEPERKFRIALPLETGMGKTTAVLALAKVLQSTDKSLLIAAERIDQLNELRLDMLNEGVDPAKLGIYHKSEIVYPDIPTVPIEDVGHVQFLLVSHSKVKADSVRNLAERLNVYLGRKRDLVIWDESLLTSNGHFISRSNAIRAANDWRVGYRDRLENKKKSLSMPDVYEEFDAFLTEVLEIMQSQDDTLRLPVLSGKTGSYRQVINMISTQNYIPPLESLVEFSQRGEVRRVDVGNEGPGLIQFVQTIDADIDQMVILDASARIRDLVDYDKTVTRYPLNATKDYSDVTINWCDARSSKDSFVDKVHLNAYLMEIDNIIKDAIPQGQDILVFTHKKLKDEVRKHFEKQHNHHQFHVLHWGEHRASNRYSDVRYVFTVGVLYRKKHELAASIIGQTNNLHHPLIDREVEDVAISEQADMLYQGFSRGHSRRSFHGKAGEQTIYLFHPKRESGRVLELLEEVMPKVRIVEHKGKYLSRSPHENSRQSRELSETIVEYLTDLGREITHLTVRKLRENVCPEIISNSSVWKNALKLAALKLLGWKKDRQTFVRRDIDL
jgi:hypothetical protein